MPDPIDPAAGSKVALAGRVVTMDGNSTVHDRGVLYIDAGKIVDARPANEAPPDGFDGVSKVDVGGTIYPGLIELHNHLAYNALQLWQVPKQYENRDDWGGAKNPDYRRLISGPMRLIGPDPDLMPAVVRYVECKALIGGTTTSQGIELFSNKAARRYYRGNIRNVEQTDDPDLPGAGAKIGDVQAGSAQSFLNTIKTRSCYILHLSEGTNDAAREHFLALRLGGDEWALFKSLAGIHAVGLDADDFPILARFETSMVWSPLSNLLLYGETAKVKAAKKAKVKIGIGSDWSPSGSKNLLGELKVARLASEAEGALFSDEQIVAMATRTAAEILKWDKELGSLEPGKRPDLLVVNGDDGDPHEHLLKATERDVALVVVAGRPRYGKRSLVERLGGEGLEDVTIGGRKRVLNLKQTTADPAVGKISLAQATDRLRDALQNLKQLALDAERRGTPLHRMLAASEADEVVWGLALDELEPTGVELRPRAPVPGGTAPTGPSLTEAKAKPLSEIVGPLELDRLTVVDDPDWLDAIDKQGNLPEWVAPGLRKLY
ncbi:MAG TPA: amidohydrolase family protein [Gaiellaceae bacterium]|nr:amidohydrolase family protein [Gaiellaceae bacterium]